MAVRQRNRGVLVTLILPFLAAACAAPAWDEDAAYEDGELTEGEYPADDGGEMVPPDAAACEHGGDCSCSETGAEVQAEGEMGSGSCPFLEGGCEAEPTPPTEPLPPAPPADIPPARVVSSAARIESDLQARTTPPPAAALAAADYGEAPLAWRATVRRQLAQFVGDLDEASVTLWRPVRGWLRADAAAPYVYAWQTKAMVRTRTDGEGWSGWQEYVFYFRGEDVLAVDTPHELVWTHSHAATPLR